MYAQSLIGTLLLGRYRVDEVLGIGGMGVVVRAVHTELDTQVAIKFLLPHMVDSANVVQRFLREAQAAVRLKGEHVAKVIDVGKMPDGAPFMVMEYLSGADLGQVLKAHGAQPPNVACDLMMQICEGMAEAHANGIVHRDVKPSNFFVTRGPDGSPLVKILDFGISKVPIGNDMQQLTGTQSMVGTPAYMAPEHMRAASRADQRSDLWSMGVVLYQLLTNRLPFDGESYADLCLKVAMDQPAPILAPLPPGLGEVLLRCLEKEASQRYQSVAQLAYALAPYCTEPVMAGAAAERCGRILEAPRGPRAPTLGEKESMGSVVPLTPYGASGHASSHRSHGSHLRSHPSSLSAGAGELSRGSGGGKSRVALYGMAAALVLVVGVGLGVFAADGGGGEQAASPGPGSTAPAAVVDTSAPAPSAPTLPKPAVAPTPAPSESTPPAAVADAPVPPAQPELQGGAEPTKAEDPAVAAVDDQASAADQKDKAADKRDDSAGDKVNVAAADSPAATSHDAAGESKTAASSKAKAAAAKAAAAKAAAAKKKKKPKSDLFNSRE